MVIFDHSRAAADLVPKAERRGPRLILSPDHRIFRAGKAEAMDMLPQLDGIAQEGLAGVLTVLALLDSTTFGTLLIPLWLLMTPGRVRPGRMLVYLGTVSGAYALIGVALLLGAQALRDRIGELLLGAAASTPGLLVITLLGVGLIVYSEHLDPMTAAGRQRQQRRRREEAESGEGRIVRWRARVMGGEAPRLAPLVGLAGVAVAVEVATMLPYLAGMALVGAYGPGLPASAGWVVYYCVVMVLPALVLLVLRLVADHAMRPMLSRLERFFSKHSAGMTAWAIGILGVVLVINAGGRLISALTA